MIVGRFWRRILPKLRPHRRFIRVAEQILIKGSKISESMRVRTQPGERKQKNVSLALEKRRRPRNALLDEPSIKKENSVIS